MSNLPKPSVTYHGDDKKLGIFTIDSLLSEQECQNYIQQSEQQGYEEAAINTGYGQEIFKDIRNNERVIFDDQLMANTLFLKIHSYLPGRLKGWSLKGLNERFRFYRYTPTQYFKWHKDGSYEADLGIESKLTLLIYLNDNFTGGATEFRGFHVTPTQGSALVFPHPLLHQGQEIGQGTKYVLRTDVMYERD